MDAHLYDACFTYDPRACHVLWRPRAHQKCTGHNDAQFCGHGHHDYPMGSLWLQHGLRAESRSWHFNRMVWVEPRLCIVKRN